jgi:hypothetical protein
MNSNSGNVDWLDGLSAIILKVNTLRMTHTEFGSYWLSGFRRSFFKKFIERQVLKDRGQEMAKVHMNFHVR